MRPFSFATTGAGLTAAPVINVSFPNCIRFTVKVRSLGTNTYLAIGDKSLREFRLTAVNDSFTFVDIPPGGIDLNLLWVQGDNVANDGVLEWLGLTEP